MEYSQLDNAKRPPMTAHASLWGLYTGLGLCFISVLQNFILKANGGVLGFGIGMLNFAITVIFLYYSMKTYRDTVPNTPYAYGQAVKLGMYQAVFASIILTAFFALTIFVLKPTFIQELEQQTIEQYEKFGFDDEMIEQSMKMARFFLSPGWLIGSSLIGTWMTGAIASLVAAAMTRRR